MKTLDPHHATEPSIVRGHRVFGALLAAIALSAAGFACCFAALFLLSADRVLERTVHHMVWVLPLLMMFVLPVVLFFIEKRFTRKSGRLLE